jgi:hypothetical protein
LTPTTGIPGWRAASQIARASLRSFFAPRQNAFTYRGASSFTR